jgi:glutathione S-transferase
MQGDLSGPWLAPGRVLVCRATRPQEAAHMTASAPLKLHGFSASNYYNIVKLALLEKDLPFEEVRVYTGANERYRPDYLTQSPLGKVPCLETPQGFLTESRCILEYLEDAYPERPLMPRDPFARAKLRELTQVIDLYLELAVRRVLPYFFAGKPPHESIQKDVRKVVQGGGRAVAALARFDRPFLFGDTFSDADLAAVIHFPVVRNIAKGVLQLDPFEGIDGLEAYLARMEDRPTVQRIRKDQSENYPEFMQHIRTHYAR